MFTELTWQRETNGHFDLWVNLPPVYHAQCWKLHTVPLIAERQAGKLWTPMFLVFGLIWPGIEPESTVLVEEALSTRPQIGYINVQLIINSVNFEVSTLSGRLNRWQLVAWLEVQVQQNLILKIMTKTSFFKTRLSPIYRQLNFLNLSSIFELEVIKFVYKFKKKTLPILFYNYFRFASYTHSYPTRFAFDLNWTVMPCKKTSTQQSICYEGCKIWNKLPIEVKSNYRLTFNNFSKKIKTYLRSKQF